jgi:hypothetical protein
MGAGSVCEVQGTLLLAQNRHKNFGQQSAGLKNPQYAWDPLACANLSPLPDSAVVVRLAPIGSIRLRSSQRV